METHLSNYRCVKNDYLTDVKYESAVWDTRGTGELNHVLYNYYAWVVCLRLATHKNKVIITLKGANDDFTAYNFKVTSNTLATNSFIGHTDYNWDSHLHATDTPAILNNFVIHKKCKFFYFGFIRTVPFG